MRFYASFRSAHSVAYCGSRVHPLKDENLTYFQTFVSFVYINCPSRFISNFELPCLGDGIALDAMCYNAHKTYTNLTQHSFGRQLQHKLAEE